MNTSELKSPYARQLIACRDVIRRGGVVAYPTESCFGLGCHPKDYLAVKKILTLKSRSATKGLILIADDPSRLRQFIKPLPDQLMDKMIASWPSATTWLVPAATWVPAWLKGDSDKIALRIPAHKFARQLCRYCGHAVVSTSANPSGRRSARSAAQVRQLFSEGVDYIVDVQCGTSRRPSTIIDLCTDQVFRP